MAEDRTLTTFAGNRGAPAHGTCASLVVALDADRPTAPSARFSLEGIDSVLLGRGPQRGVERSGRRLELRLPDKRMSSKHARLEKALGKWVAADEGSKNGTYVDGEKIDRASLRDGAVLEIGHALLLFRSAAPIAPDARADQLELPPGLRTLSTSYAERIDRLLRVAPSSLPIILGGESGSGKEVVARAVHALSGRQGPFVAINCGAIPETLVESQLFGSRKGAFSGAEDRPGFVRNADGGTLLLDEISDLPASSQTALLRVLQEGEVVPVGDASPVKVDVRVVSATHRDLVELVEKGAFRGDLYSRLTGFRLSLPPLRERLEDLGLLVASLLAKLAGDRAHEIRFTREAASLLFRFSWPFNIRELEKCLSAAVALAGESAIAVEHLPEEVRASAVQPDEPALSDEDRARRDALVDLLTEHGGNVSAVARAMGKSRPQIHQWINRYGIDVARFRDR